MRVTSVLLLVFWLMHPPGYLVAQPASSWEPVNMGLDSDSVFALAATSDGLLFAGTEHGIYRSDDDGNAWVGANTNLPDVVIGSLAVDPIGILYAATHGEGVYRSTDDGDSWEAVNNGLASKSVTEVAVDSSGIVYAGAFLGGVFRSLDEGDTWEIVDDNGLDNPFVPSLAVNAAGIVFHGSDGGVYRSLDDGDSWEALTSGLDNPFVEELVVSRDDVLFAGTDGGVYRSLDDGDSWEVVHDETLGSRTVRTLVTNASYALFAGTHGGGVFRSLDHGASWEAVNDGLENLYVSALAVGLDGSLYAGTVGGGIFKRSTLTDVSGQTEDAIPTDFELSGNYPNPFNPTTLIRYALPTQSAVKLTVYDAAGRQVAVLVDSERPAGRHEVAFDATKLPSGVYFYRLDAGSFSEVEQMVLLR